MAATLFLLPTIDSHNYLTLFQPKQTLKSKLQSLSLTLPKRSNLSITNSPFTCHSSDHSSIPFNTQTTPQKVRSFLTNEEVQKLESLQNYTYNCKLSSGYLSIRVMNEIEVDKIAELLAESFAESMFLTNMYLKVLGFLIKQYLVDRRGLMPYCATLIGVLKSDDEEEEEKEEELAGTVEVSFDFRGANASPPSPSPPKNCPYICNMSVKEHLRRRGIGWHLLKASEELISTISSSRNVYLHCRMIDEAPFNMYKKAGYAVVKTDSLFVLLKLQRRKHLMYKELPALSKPLETVISGDEDEVPTSIDGRELEPISYDEVLQSSLDMDN